MNNVLIEAKTKLNQILYYIIIGVISICAVVVVPLISSDMNAGFNFPDTTLGWILYVGSGAFVATINMVIFYSFQQQAKINISKDEKKLEADNILFKLALKHPQKVKKPRSPRRYNTQAYGVKGTTTFITSFLASLVFVQAVIRFDFISMIVYALTMLFGLVLGFINMKNAENYWTIEYYEYAKMKEVELSEKETVNDN